MDSLTATFSGASGCVHPTSKQVSAARTRSIPAGRIHKARDRFVITLETEGRPCKYVLGGAPEVIRDVTGVEWRLPKLFGHRTHGNGCTGPPLALSATGTLCTLEFLVFRAVPRVVRKALEGAPDGPMSDALRSAVPVVDPTPRLHRQFARLFQIHQNLRHPNILAPAAFSCSVEGGAVVLWDCSPGATLRQVFARYPPLRRVTYLRFAMGALSALASLHAKGAVHGRLSLDHLVVGADGACYLSGNHGDYRLDNELFAVRRTCYLSPAMAAGAPPTPACDMFCYGLACIEGATHRPAWMWAAVGDDDGQERRSEAELRALMAAGGQAFADAVVCGAVVPAISLVDAQASASQYDAALTDATRDCVSYDPAKRPTAQKMRALVKAALARVGLDVAEE